MKTDINNFTAAALLARLAVLAPSVSIETIWEHDTDIHPDIRKDCDMPADTDPDDWQAWQSEVRASCIVAGALVSGSEYMGGTWEKFGDDPAESNPEISGYLPQMIEAALEELGRQLPAKHPASAEIAAALEVI